MVNTAETGGSSIIVSEIPKLPPKLKKNSNLSRPKVPPPSPPIQSKEFTACSSNSSIYDTPPPVYDAPPIPVVSTLPLPCRKDDSGRLSDGEDYLPLDDQSNSHEAIYTPLESKIDEQSDADDYDDVEYINVKYIRPPPSRKELDDAIAKSPSESKQSNGTDTPTTQNGCHQEGMSNTENIEKNNTGNQNGDTCNEHQLNGLSSQIKEMHMNGAPTNTKANGHTELCRKSSYTKPQTCLASRIHQFENF